MKFEHAQNTLKYKVGDRVQVNAGAGFSADSKGVVVEYSAPSEFDCPPKRLLVLRDGTTEPRWFYPDELTLLKAAESSNEKPSFVSFFTSVIVAKNKDVSDIGEMLYDDNTTKIYLEDEGGGAFLIVEQDYNGAIQQIRLDIDEVDTVFSAIKQLVNQMEVK